MGHVVEKARQVGARVFSLEHAENALNRIHQFLGHGGGIQLRDLGLHDVHMPVVKASSL